MGSAWVAISQAVDLNGWVARERLQFRVRNSACWYLRFRFRIFNGCAIPNPNETENSKTFGGFPRLLFDLV